MKTILTAIIALVAGLAWSGSVGSMSVYAGWKGINTTTNVGDVVPYQYIVTLKDTADPDTVANRHGLALGHAYNDAIKGFSGSLSKGQMQKLWLDSDVLDIESDTMGALAAQTLPVGVNRIGTTNSTIAKINGIDERVNVGVAIVDTGIDNTHPDLHVTSIAAFIKKNRKATGKDDNGHGTHVAGTVGALDNTIGVVGVAPGVNLYGVKVFDSTGNGPMSDAIAGLNYVAKNSSAIAVCNMSFYYIGVSAALRTAVSNCVAKGIVCVACAGNSGANVYGADGLFGTADDYIPAAYPEVITVSAMCDYDGIAGGLSGIVGDGGPDDTLASWSNYGQKIDLAAPGVSVLSTLNNGGYGSLSGTSMAAPHVAGAAALYISAHGRATTYAGAQAIKSALVAAGQAQTSWGPANTRDKDAYPEPLVIAP